MSQQGDAFDPARELAEIAAAVRAHVEWQKVSGAVGLPRGERLPGAAPAALSSASAPAPVSLSSAPAPFAASAPAPVSLSSAPASRSAPASPPAFILAPPSPAPASPPPRPEPAPGSGPAPAPVPPTPAVPLTPEERHRRLEILAESIRGCTRCALHAGRTQTVFARGLGSVGLCFVGEGPGADEDAQGFPFVGKAGQLLDRMIGAMGFARDDVYVCNIVKCRPPENRKPEPEEMAACVPYLAEQLEILGPEVIVALGATAVQGLFGTSEGITRLRGRWKLYRGRVPVMPTFHPAFLLRNPAAKKEVWDDLQAVLRQMGRAPPGRP